MANRVLVIGLDGMSHEALDALIARGVTPTLASVVGSGARGVLASTHPACTCPAWPTMCTGLDPGRHGVFSFIWRGEAGSARLMTAADLAAPRFWKVAADAGLRSAVLFVPTMFPADPVRPLAVSGFPAADRPGSGIVFPPEAEEDLRKIVPVLESENPHLKWSVRGEESELQAKARAVREKGEADARQVAAVFDFACREPLDLAMAAFSLPDHLFHTYYGCAVAGNDSPPDVLALRDAIDHAFRAMDDAIAKMLARFGQPATVLVVSDHGFTRKRGTFHVAECLRQAGLLRPAGLRYLLARSLRGRRPRKIFEKMVAEASWDDPRMNWRSTLAFPAQDHEEGIFINLKGRNPRGIVSPEESAAVIERVREALLAVRESATGEAPVYSVRRREEVYAGPYVDRAPDLAVELADGWTMPSKLSWRMRGKCPAQRSQGWAGVHRSDAILLAAGPAVRPGTAPVNGRLADVAPTVLALVGLESAQALDGRALDEMFLFPAERKRVVVGPASGAAGGYSADDEAIVARRLAELGYL
jgi:predicted AlkP superfamily phosphohydrolase/phosphomutase